MIINKNNYQVDFSKIVKQCTGHGVFASFKSLASRSFGTNCVYLFKALYRLRFWLDEVRFRVELSLRLTIAFKRITSPFILQME